MIKSVFSFGNGAAVLDDDKLCVCIVDNDGNKKICGKTLKKTKKILNFPLIRGLFYYFYGFYIYINSYFLGLSIGVNNQRIKKLNIFSSFIIFLAILISAFLVGLVIFNFLPSFILNRLIEYEISYYLKSFIISLLKTGFLVAIFAVLKFCPFMNGIYSFNGAGCIMLNKKSEKEALMWRNYPLNFLNFLLNVSILSSFVISLVAIKIFWALDVVINLAIYFACVIFVYEFLHFATFTKHTWLKDITMITNFFVCNRPKTTHIEVLRVIKKEMTSYQDFERIDGELVPLSFVYAEMETKLRTFDRYEPSDVDWIICNVLGKNRAEVKLCRGISKKDYSEIMRCCDRKAKGEPLSSIFGFVDFYGLRFDVNKKVLSPRMETEILVEEVIKKVKENSFESILDLCTGSGAIAVTLAKFTDCKVTASDISKQALAVAEGNAKKNDVKVEFVCSDLFNGLKKTKKYDIIVSNPPYIKRSDIEKLDVEVKNYDPKLALDGGEDGLVFYKKITRHAPEKLSRGGYLFFEIGEGQRQDVEKMLLDEGFEDIKVVKDYNKIERIIYGRKRTWIIGKDSKNKG